MSSLSTLITKIREALGLAEGLQPVKRTPKNTGAPKPKAKAVPPKAAPKPKPPASTRLEGIDYSFGNGVTAQEIKSAGKSFVFRYLSEEGNPKNIDKQELWNLTNVGLKVGFYWETTADRMLSGKLGGIADAYAAKRELERLGVGWVPVYYGADFDAKESQQGAINAYLDGASEVRGKRVTGLYGGFYVVKRAFDAKKTTYAVQTYAWSGSQWDPRAQVQQYQNGVRLGPAEVDLLRTNRKDYGQWPK